mmetsp:Transcript_31972/g.101783  ORF Transcript_31972/g.101783 Transcript_31972/m.101783 type:complete len:214 (+) Transcript_31972:212-853(+)
MALTVAGRVSWASPQTWYSSSLSSKVGPPPPPADPFLPFFAGDFLFFFGLGCASASASSAASASGSPKGTSLPTLRTCAVTSFAMRNMVQLSTQNTSRASASQRIWRLSSGFCRSCSRMYAHKRLVISVRGSSAAPTNCCRAGEISRGAWMPELPPPLLSRLRFFAPFFLLFDLAGFLSSSSSSYSASSSSYSSSGSSLMFSPYTMTCDASST